MNHISDDDSRKHSSVTTWMTRFREGDSDAGQKLYQRYFNALAGHARRIIPGDMKRMADEEDMAIQALTALLHGLKAGRFRDLNNRDELWQLMTLIVHRRVLNLIRQETRKKRPRAGSATDSQIGKGTQPNRLRTTVDENDPAWMAMAMDNLRQMFRALPREDLQQVARLRMSGFSVEEIARELGVVRRTVERKLHLIRECWRQFL